MNQNNSVTNNNQEENMFKMNFKTMERATEILKEAIKDAAFQMITSKNVDTSSMNKEWRKKVQESIKTAENEIERMYNEYNTILTAMVLLDRYSVYTNLSDNSSIEIADILPVMEREIKNMAYANLQDESTIKHHNILNININRKIKKVIMSRNQNMRKLNNDMITMEQARVYANNVIQNEINNHV